MNRILGRHYDQRWYVLLLQAFQHILLWSSSCVEILHSALLWTKAKKCVSTSNKLSSYKENCTPKNPLKMQQSNTFPFFQDGAPTVTEHSSQHPTINNSQFVQSVSVEASWNGILLSPTQTGFTSSFPKFSNYLKIQTIPNVL